MINKYRQNLLYGKIILYKEIYYLLITLFIITNNMRPKPNGLLFFLNSNLSMQMDFVISNSSYLHNNPVQEIFLIRSNICEMGFLYFN